MKLRERMYASGRVAWQVDFGVVDGRRLQKSYLKKADAVNALADARASRKRHGEMAPVLSSIEAADFVTARARLAAVGASVQEAVDYFLKHAAAVRERVTVPVMVQRFIETKRAAGRAKRGLETISGVLGSLSRWLPQVDASDVTRDHIAGWLRGGGWSARTQNKRRAFASTCFRWAIKESLAVRNPCEGIELLRESQDEIGTLTVDECRRLLEGAVESGVRVMCYVALGLFCGLRRSELESLSWEHLDLKEGTVIVLAAKTKTRQRRVVEIPDVALAWLKAARAVESGHGSDGARVVPSNLREWWPEFRERCGVKQWPHNALRHTFASMHYAQFQDEASLQAIMGHRSADELFGHYRALKTKAEAARFWALTPAESEPKETKKGKE